MLIPENILHECGPLEVGVVGAGRITRMAHLSLIENIPSVEIKFISDIEIDKAERLAKFYGGTPYEVTDPESLPECDALLLAIPVGVRDDYIEEFGERSTPIFTEKPFATDINKHNEYLDHSDEILCNYMRTNFSSTRQMRTIMHSDLFGQLKRVELAEGDIMGSTGHEQQAYLTDASLSGGEVLMEKGTHLLSQLVLMFDSNELKVTESQITYDGEFDIDVSSTIEARLKGREIEIDLQMSLIRQLDNEIRLVFEHGEAVIEPNKPGAQVQIRPPDPNTRITQALSHDDLWAVTLPQAVYIRWMEFLNICLDRPVNHPFETIETAPKVTELITKMYRNG